MADVALFDLHLRRNAGFFWRSLGGATSRHSLRMPRMPQIITFFQLSHPSCEALISGTLASTIVIHPQVKFNYAHVLALSLERQRGRERKVHRVKKHFNCIEISFGFAHHEGCLERTVKK